MRTAPTRAPAHPSGSFAPSETCECCGEDLTGAACLGHQRRTFIDAVFEKVVRHVDAQLKHCSRCHTDVRARFPDEMPGPLQYDNGLKAHVVLHTLVAQMLSLERVAPSLHTVIAQRLSEVTLLHYVLQFHQALAERDLRISKVKQKVSGWFRTRRYAEVDCRISSYLQSMANQGYNPLVAIQIDLAGRAVENMGE